MNSSSECLQPSVASKAALPIIYSLLLTVGVCGNSISLWLFSSQMNRKTSTHIYLTNLVFSNLLVCGIMPLIIAYYINGNQWAPDSMTCKTIIGGVMLTMHSNMYISITILCWIAISRYATLMKHRDSMQESLQYVYEKIFYGRILKKFRQPQFAKYLCTGLWIIVMFLTTPIIVYYSVIQSDQTQHHTCYNTKTEVGEHLYQISGLVASGVFFFFFAIVLLSYYLLTDHLKKMQTNTCIGKKNLIYKKVKRNIIVILVVLTICFVPYHIFKVAFYALALNTQDCYQLNYLIELKSFFFCLAVSRSSIDPIVYIFLDKTFKKHLFNLCRKSSTLQLSNVSPMTKQDHEPTQQSTPDKG
ncbi:probable G-protein coupled receptor 82 [Rhinatrema bivittatum]|uniref:probable G-protein coupled receptor 82 n=1 Tax=Rhinatrema bivittatum TaxID=194408 RepID=UPI001129E101|nr:probable G-protein coupled receptor 82 [Rhinatrema bivittatum]